MDRPFGGDRWERFTEAINGKDGLAKSFGRGAAQLDVGQLEALQALLKSFL